MVILTMNVFQVAEWYLSAAEYDLAVQIFSNLRYDNDHLTQ